MESNQFAKKAMNLLQAAWYRNQWYLMFDLREDISTSFCQFKTMIPPEDRFWADPHVIQNRGRYYIFVEEYLYKTRKGHIAVIEMDERGQWKEPVRALEGACHLSYPFVFEWEGRYYMVPESAENMTIGLYECVEFPYKWQFKLNLMENVYAVDTTLFHHEGRWWLFTGLAEHKKSLPFVKLYLFFSTDLLTGAWSPHPLNPIKPDTLKARPAGRVFTYNERLFRPSQDCSKMYGYGFDLNEIVVLSKTDYVEKEDVAVRPDWDKKIRATHTFSHVGQLTTIDALRRRPRLGTVLASVSRRQ